MTDLDLKAVLHKTEAGVNAIKVRDRALNPRQRMLLILVDGIKTVADLSKTMPSPEEAQQFLTDLLNAGFVHVPVAVKAALVPTSVEAKPASSVPAEPLKVAVKRATRLLEVLLGPSCEPMCVQLEKCATHEEFAARVNKLRTVVASIRSEKKATEFVEVALGLPHST